MQVTENKEQPSRGHRDRKFLSPLSRARPLWLATLMLHLDHRIFLEIRDIDGKSSIIHRSSYLASLMQTLSDESVKPV